MWKRRAAPPSVNLGPPNISETTRPRKLKFYTHLDRAKHSFQVWKLLHWGACGGVAARHIVNLGPPRISESIIARKLKFYTHLDKVKCTIRKYNFFRQGISKGAVPPSVNLGPLISRELLELESWNLHTFRKRQFHFSEIIFPLGDVRGAQRPYCQFGTPHISETIGARMLRFYTHLARAKYSLRVWKFFC